MDRGRRRLPSRRSRRAIHRILETILMGLLCVQPAQGQIADAERPLMAEEVFKDVQVLKGIPVTRFMATMGFFSASLGADCTSCHVAESGGSWAKYADNHPRKQAARRMILMVNTINQTNFGGRQLVTCNTCHRGSFRPNVMPSLSLLYGTPLPEDPGGPFAQSPGQPPADQILDKYLFALGGAEVLAKLVSFAAKGTYVGFDDADKSAVEIFARAPDQRTTIVHTLSGDNITVHDGRAAWIAAPATERPVPLVVLAGQELDAVRLEAGLMFPSRIKQALTNWRVGLPATIGDGEVHVVQGNTANGATATLCFDSETGLLVRLVWVIDSPVGRLPTQIDYGDYREVSGVKMPFTWKVTWLDGRSTFALSEVQPNVPIDAARFVKPASAPPPR
jgi:hypothetical protein